MSHPIVSFPAVPAASPPGHRLRGLLLAWAVALLGIPAAWAEPVYSTNPPHAGRAKVVPVFIDASFPAADQEQIASALEEWNRALNGVARFDRVAAASEPVDGTRPWLIRKGAGRDGVRETGRKAQSLGTAQPLPMGGGVLIVFSGAGDVLKGQSLTLRDVMMRELGHLVGLRHDSHGELLAAEYRAGDASCVDKETAQEVARHFAVPLEALNWCDPKAR